VAVPAALASVDRGAPRPSQLSLTNVLSAVRLHNVALKLAPSHRSGLRQNNAGVSIAERANVALAEWGEE
jgi:hypothetical protein